MDSSVFRATPCVTDARVGQFLIDKTWVGFDLDDTLHDFRSASSTAVSATLQVVAHEKHIHLSELEDQYAIVLKERTANAFDDGRTSFDYRRERFTAVLTHFGVSPDSDFLDKLLDTYEATLTCASKVKPGAEHLLATIKQRGFKTVIVTEGPQDAQERAIEVLGIKPYIDFLATTNFFRVSKTNGLFGKVLQYLKIDAKDMVYIGDSKTRDMIPAIAAGIPCIHFVEGERCVLDHDLLQINSLQQLQDIFFKA